LRRASVISEAHRAELVARLTPLGEAFFLLTLAYVLKYFEFVDPLSWSRALLAVAGSIMFAIFLKITITDPIERWRAAIRREGAAAERPKLAY
jgi:hypothetical protein